MTGTASARSSRMTAPMLLTIGLIQAIWPLTMDLYLPAFPRIAAEFDSPAALVQATLTGAFIGMAIGQLTAGPLSDAIGRVRPLTIALILYIVATLACAIAPSIEALIALRFVQGIAASAGSVVTLAIVRDSASGPRMVALLARLQLVTGVFVVGSPALGAQLLGIVDWRGLFWVLVVYGVLLLLATLSVLFRHETNPPERRAARAGVRVRDDYRILWRDRRFVGVMAMGALLFAGMMSYMASSAFLFQERFGLSPTAYALLFGGHGLLMIIGAQVSARLARRIGVTTVLRAGLAAIATGTIALVLSVGLAPGWGMLGFVLPLFVFVGAYGFVSPAISSLALGPHPDRAGTAASWLGAGNMIAGAIAAPVVGLFGEGEPVVTAVAMLLCSLMAVAAAWLGLRSDVTQVEPEPAPEPEGAPERA